MHIFFTYDEFNAFKVFADLRISVLHIDPVLMRLWVGILHPIVWITTTSLTTARTLTTYLWNCLWLKTTCGGPQTHVGNTPHWCVKHGRYFVSILIGYMRPGSCNQRFLRDMRLLITTFTPVHISSRGTGWPQNNGALYGGPDVAC